MTEALWWFVPLAVGLALGGMAGAWLAQVSANKDLRLVVTDRNERAMCARVLGREWWDLYCAVQELERGRSSLTAFRAELERQMLERHKTIRDRARGLEAMP